MFLVEFPFACAISSFLTTECVPATAFLTSISSSIGNSDNTFLLVYKEVISISVFESVL
jgi:hypothetical protein